MLSGDPGTATSVEGGGGPAERLLPGRRKAPAVSMRTVLLLLPGLCVGAFLALPLLAIFLKVLPQPDLWQTFQQPVVTNALWLSLITSLSSLLMAVLFGTPVAYLLARQPFRGAGVIETLL